MDVAARKARPGEELTGLRPGARDELVRDAVVGQQPADLVRARRCGVADDGDLPRPEPDRTVPLVEELGDGAVEVLVRRVPRPDDVVVDLPLRHEGQHHVSSVTVPPGAPLHEQAASYVGKEPGGDLEHRQSVVQLAGVVREQERHLPAVARRGVQGLSGLARGATATTS